MNHKVIFETSMGNFTVELHDDKVPETAQNFLDYVKDGFYDGTIFHRIIKGFVVQGGGFDAHMQQKITRDPIRNQADEGASNRKYSLSMARTGDPHSATSQFFINLHDNAALDYRAKDIEGWGYCVFGEVIEGQEVIDKMAEVATGRRDGHADVPVEPVVVHTAFEQVD